jgi:hypothetical protein
VTATVTGSLGRTGPRKARPAQSRVARRAIQDGFGTGKAPGVGQGHPLVGRPLGRGGGRGFLSSFPSLSFLPFSLSFPPCLALSRETRLRFLPAGHLWRSRPPAGRGVGSRWLCSTGRVRTGSPLLSAGVAGSGFGQGHPGPRWTQGPAISRPGRPAFSLRRFRTLPYNIPGRRVGFTVTKSWAPLGLFGGNRINTAQVREEVGPPC